MTVQKVIFSGHLKRTQQDIYLCGAAAQRNASQRDSTHTESALESSNQSSFVRRIL
jgi:hypothetical protein